jgi:hypothetical protein
MLCAVCIKQEDVMKIENKLLQLDIDFSDRLSVIARKLMKAFNEGRISASEAAAFARFAYVAVKSEETELRSKVLELQVDSKPLSLGDGNE